MILRLLGSINSILSRLELKVDTLIRQGKIIMAKVDELLADLAEANATTNEVADDVTELLSKIVEGGLSPEETEAVKAQIVALNTRLKGVASQYPAVPPAPPSAR